LNHNIKLKAQRSLELFLPPQ